MRSPIQPAAAPSKAANSGMRTWRIMGPVVFGLMALGCRQGGNTDTDTSRPANLPANFPSDVPVYAGMAVRNTMTPPGGNTAVFFAGSGTTKDIAAFYEKQLTNKGWTKVKSVDSYGVLMLYSKGTRTVEVHCTGHANETTMEITYTIQN